MMRFIRKLFPQPPIPPIVESVNVDPGASIADLNKAVNASIDAREQEAQAHEAVTSLSRSLLRNGFAPAIEAGYLRKYLGGTN